MKKYIIIALLSLFISLFASSDDYIVAKAGKDIILKSDIQKQILQMKSSKYWTENDNVASVLEDMIDAKIIIVKAKELGLSVDDNKIKMIIDKQISSIKGQFPNEEAFYSELRKANLTLSDLKKYYEEMLTEQQLKDQLIQSQIKKKVQVSDLEIRKYYEDNKSDILKDYKKYQISLIMRNVKASQQTKDLALSKISDIQAQIKKGKKFEKLAKELSDCPSGQNGGDLGYFSRGMMVKPFEDAAFALKVGEVSDIVETQFGYHLIRLDEIKDKEIKASHILIKTDPNENDIIIEKEFMDSLFKRLQNGEAFDQLATQYSEDDSSKIHSGVIGNYSVSEFPEMFSDQISSIDENGFTEVINSENTFFIFGKKALQDSEDSFNNYKNNIKQILLSKKQMDYYSNWISQVRNEFYIHIYQDRLDELKKELQ